MAMLLVLAIAAFIPVADMAYKLSIATFIPDIGAERYDRAGIAEDVDSGQHSTPYAVDRPALPC